MGRILPDAFQRHPQVDVVGPVRAFLWRPVPVRSASVLVRAFRACPCQSVLLRRLKHPRHAPGLLRLPSSKLPESLERGLRPRLRARPYLSALCLRWHEHSGLPPLEFRDDTGRGFAGGVHIRDELFDFGTFEFHKLPLDRTDETVDNLEQLCAESGLFRFRQLHRPRPHPRIGEHVAHAVGAEFGAGFSEFAVGFPQRGFFGGTRLRVGGGVQRLIPYVGKVGSLFAEIVGEFVAERLHRVPAGAGGVQIDRVAVAGEYAVERRAVFAHRDEVADIEAKFPTDGIHRFRRPAFRLYDGEVGGGHPLRRVGGQPRQFRAAVVFDVVMLHPRRRNGFRDINRRHGGATVTLRHAPGSGVDSPECCTGPCSGGSVLRQFSPVQHGGGITRDTAPDHILNILQRLFAAFAQSALADGTGKTVVQGFYDGRLAELLRRLFDRIAGDGVGGPAVDQRADALSGQRHVAESGFDDGINQRAPEAHRPDFVFRIPVLESLPVILEIVAVGLGENGGSDQRCTGGAADGSTGGNRGQEGGGLSRAGSDGTGDIGRIEAEGGIVRVGIPLLVGRQHGIKILARSRRSTKLFQSGGKAAQAGNCAQRRALPQFRQYAFADRFN